MYTLQLTNGASIQGLERLNPVTYWVQAQPEYTMQLLSDRNLEFATLVDEESGEMEDIFLDATLQNYSNDGQIIRFRLGTVADRERWLARPDKKERRKKKRK